MEEFKRIYRHNIPNEKEVLNTKNKNIFLIGILQDHSQDVIPCFKIGGVYYAIKDGNLVAFKVLAIVLGISSVEFKIITAENENLQLVYYDEFFNHCFESINDYHTYQETYNSAYQVGKCNIYFYIEPYLRSNTQLHRIIRGRNMYISAQTFTLDDANNVIENVSHYQAFWIDTKGLHFIAVAGEGEYFSYDECSSSSKIIRFKDESNQQDKNALAEINMVIKIPLYKVEWLKQAMMPFSGMVTIK